MASVTETETKTELELEPEPEPEPETETEEFQLPPGWEEFNRLVGIAPASPPANQSLLSRLARPWRQCFARFHPDSIPFGQPLTEEQMERLQRHGRPGHFKRLAMDREVTIDCLHYYNLNHPGNEYEPAPGKVYWNAHFHNGICWIHGNFVARKKSFLPAPRALFFFELAHTKDFEGVAACTPLAMLYFFLDEPVTESYSVLGFPLGFSTRRSGKLDAFCKTCNTRFDLPHPGIQKTFVCGHQHVDKVCEMCYLRSCVLHPRPGGFVFGHR